MNRQRHHTGGGERSGYLASVMGWLSPGRAETAREGAAGSTLVAGAAAFAASAITVSAVRRVRRR